MNNPFIDKYQAPSCHLQKFLISRSLLESEYPRIIAKAYEFLCKRKMHIYIQAKTEGVLCCLICRIGIIPPQNKVGNEKATSKVKSCLCKCTFHSKVSSNTYHCLMKIGHPQKDHLCGICVNQGKYKKEAQKYVNYINGLHKEGELNLAKPEKPVLLFFDKI